MAKIGVIIPVRRLPALADEAIRSCVAQRHGPDFRIILVNDGCECEETRRCLESWNAAYPDQITLLSQARQGLSRARNAGVEFALKDPETDAIFFLDAENRLDPNALAVFGELLADKSEAGWFFPQVDRFGVEANISNGGAWSLALLAAGGYCETGGLVRRKVFETGLRFDPSFAGRAASWDFWLGAAKQGFTGEPITQSTVRFRAHIAADARDFDAAILAQIEKKHAWLFSTKRLSDAWNAEWPRFAMVSTNGEFSIGSEPAVSGQITGEQFIARVFNNRANPAESRFPPMLVFYAPEALKYLEDAKLLDSCFYQLEGALRDSPAAAVTLTDGSRNFSIGSKTRDSEGALLAGCDIIAISVHHLNAALDQGEMENIISYLIENVSVVPITIELPEHRKESGSALDALMDVVGRLILSPMSQVSSSQYRNWRAQAYVPVREAVIKHNAGGRPALSPLPEGRHVGFVIQVFHFGGIEKCLVALARELVSKGIFCHLFIYGNDRLDAADWMFEPFSKIWVLNHAALRDWQGPRYLGASGSEHPGDEVLGDALGPLTQMDAVVNCGAGVMFHGLAALGRRGIKTANWEHMTERTVYGRSSGSPYVSVSHEAECDKIFTCSNQLATRMAAQGVPRNKLLPLPNGPGYVEKGPTKREAPADRIRVGFLGRFDPQKQVEKFIEVAQVLRNEIDFKATGGAVLGEPVEFPEWLKPAPPIKSRAGLDEFYASIDVLILPSRDEGLPLTILEAQRAGVVVLASDVGAVNEAITDGETGILLRQEHVVADAVAALQKLNQDREALVRIAQNAAGKPDQWQQNAERFIDSLL